MNIRAWTGALTLLAIGGCNRMAANIDFERMIDQAKFEAYEADYSAVRGESERVPARGGVMRHPPAGTVARDRLLDVELAATTRPGGPYREQIPLIVDRRMLERGRDRYERFCGACHGIAGYGNSPVVENMALRPPPSLHDADIKRQSVGQIYNTISAGYGLMPSYAEELDSYDRWAIVAYVRALWLSEGAELAELPADLRARAEQELR